IAHYRLDAQAAPQHYALGIKEVWEIAPEQARPGHVLHTLGWPLAEHGASGGGFLYHQGDNKVALGLFTDLNYANPWLSPFEEFQRYKHHPVIAEVLKNGKRLSYGARASVKGGLQALPKLYFPGGILVGDDAGFLNVLKLKGTHTAMHSGLLAAEALFAALGQQTPPGELSDYQRNFETSSLHKELHKSRNVGPALHKLGTLPGAAFSWFDQTLCRGKLPFTLRDGAPDHATLQDVAHARALTYAKPDNVLSFDRLSSLYLSGTFHEEDQPCHLQLIDPEIPIAVNLPRYAEPAQRYCPAGVYEIAQHEGAPPRLQINAQNCLHCKTCDIKDPTQNIRWVAPEGGGGPNYSDM
ncbi:MAG: electron transfer flavoprotein-ubiquinone oxidoreductase, partial [Pseudomonadales bacterium]|nr:electron transfer flavoprotein-ubiquinone oxidoreductase [Pseudomonadales bacterium]